MKLKEFNYESNSDSIDHEKGDLRSIAKMYIEEHTDKIELKGEFTRSEAETIMKLLNNFVK